MNKPTFTLGNSLIIFASLAMFISVMSLNASYSNIQSFTTVDLTEYTQLPAEINKPVTWINDNTQQTVETEPPEVVETDTSEVDGKLQKRVIVSSDIHYEKILTYASVPELLSEQVKLFWIINGSKIDVTEREDFNVTFYDENSNNLIDKISWITPHLSEQEFILEFDITVINPWTTGVSGGEWRVYFTTTGIGTLNITKDELSNQVLTFNYIKCGETTLQPSISEYSYIIENYSCSEIAEISHTIGEMPSQVFGMQFDFGNDFNNDVDFAYDPLPDPDTDGDGLLDAEELITLKYCNGLGSNPLDINAPVGGGGGCAALAAGQCENKRHQTITDADGDCLSSEYELVISGTNPSAADTDGGGESDYSEAVAGRDPNNPGDDVSANNAPVWTQVIIDPTVNEDSGLAVVDPDLTASGSGQCTDADGDTLTFAVVGENAAEVDCTISGNVLTQTPAANWYGTAACEIRCNDGTTTVDDQFSIIVTSVNDPPVLTGIPDFSRDEDSGLSNNIVNLYDYHSDVDGSDAATTFSITSQSSSGIINCVLDNDQYLDCTTVANQYGESDINITATDAGSLTDTDIFRIVVNPINDAPTSGTPTISPSSPSDSDDIIGLNTSFADNDGDTLTAIYDWRLEGVSVAELNIPMNIDRTPIRDYSSTVTNGTAIGSPSFSSSCKSGGCFNFDGTDDYIDFGDITTFDGAEALTISAWVYDSDTSDGVRYIVGKWYGSAGGGGQTFKLYTYLSDRDQLIFSISDGSNNCQKRTTSTTAFSANTWHHIAAIWRGGNDVEIWIDGNNEPIATHGSCNSVSSLYNSDERLTIGNKYNGAGTPVQFWDGKIDQVLIFNRSISAEQVGFLNASSTLIYNKTSDGGITNNDNWTVSVTPNDALLDGTTRLSAVKNIGSSNTAPTDISWDSGDNDVPENSAATTVVGTFSETDAEGGSMTWTEQGSGNGTSLFQIASSTGVVTVTSGTSLNYESAKLYSYPVRVTDSGGLYYDELNHTIDITNVNEAPVWAQNIDSPTVDADSSQVTLDPDLTASGYGQCTDVDGGTTLSFTEVGSPTNVECTLSSTNNRLLSIQPATNFSGTSTCTIRCSDTSLTVDNTFTTTVSKTLSMSLSTNLANDLDWAISNTTGISWDASENNGAGVTGYYVTIEAHGGEPNVTIKSSGDLSKGSGTDIPIFNYNYKNSTTNTVPGLATIMTTTYVNAATDLAAAASHNVYFKFFLIIPDSTAAGTYTTTTYFQGVV